ncbi:CocE/NonD family hydrolase [Sphingomonas segetis]|jgi:putative CocE/NonD family hydrolase|uniref:CocE/NonD family hydrolase n=1 Tax=Sphingomonas segetis TaxID=1104779 RepID=UPI0012D32F03|nr:CocE/NonD family hydrolase [Sphingomonas segetis]
MKNSLLRLTAALLPLLALAAAPAPQRVTPMTPDVVASYNPILPQADFIRREAMVPMRDGTKLYTVIFMKKGTTNGPILLSRTPYDAKGSTDRTASLKVVDKLPIMYKEFVEDGYIIVQQDIRGLHNSEGTFVMNRPIVGPLNNTGIDESTDAYDTIDWLVKNVPESNGKVGTIGSSYLGFLTLASEINPHPALKAAVPQSPMVDGWMGDDWFHNGAYRTGGFDFGLSQSTGKADAGASVPVGTGDDYTRYLEAGSMADYARKYQIENVPFVQKLMQNPAYTEFWSGQAVDKWMAAHPLTVPTMLEVGQWDQEDSYGAPAVYKALKDKYEGSGLLHLVIGPWRHSGANHYGYELGDLTFNGDTALQWRQDNLKPFLDHYLKGAPDPHTPAAYTYATGINKWEASPRWPMGTPTPIYLTANSGVSFDKPGASGHDDYVSDPARPVPYLPRPITGDQWKTWLVTDQRFVDGRTDVLTYTGAPLTKAVHIMGAPQVDLFAATTGTDSDWVVKLIDVYPNENPEGASQGSKRDMSGFELPIGIEIFRGRYVDSFAQPHALTPGKVTEFKWNLPNVDHVFLPGHKIMVQVQSSLFPLYDRNPQSFVPNIFYAKAGDYRAARQSVFTGGNNASAVYLPIVP